jgi:hypothetical protein
VTISAEVALFNIAVWYYILKFYFILHFVINLEQGVFPLFVFGFGFVLYWHVDLFAFLLQILRTKLRALFMQALFP